MDDRRNPERLETTAIALSVKFTIPREKNSRLDGLTDRRDLGQEEDGKDGDSDELGMVDAEHGQPPLPKRPV